MSTHAGGPDPIPGADELAAQRGAAIVRAASLQVSAPHRLREQIEQSRARHARGGRQRAWGLGAVASLAAAAIVAAVLVTGTSASGPTVAQAAALAHLPPTLAAPRVDPRTPAALDVRESGVQFPNWHNETAWKASGQRVDRLHGRHATTVFYDAAGLRVAYTIVGGGPLATPRGVVTMIDGERYVTIPSRSRTIITWRRNGHTCVVSTSSAVPPANLIALAGDPA